MLTSILNIWINFSPYSLVVLSLKVFLKVINLYDTMIMLLCYCWQ